MIYVKPIFNVNGVDSKYTRKIIGGDSTNIVNLADVRYPWAVQLYDVMKGFDWNPQKADMTGDKTDYLRLTEQEKFAFKHLLSFLIFLDSIQIDNLSTAVTSRITAPEIKLCIAQQVAMEGVHAKSYQYMLQSIFPEEEQKEVYDLWKHYPPLLKRVAYIAKLYQQYLDNCTLENYYILLIANYILESVYFYMG